MRGPTGLKFCTMVSTRPNFIMPVQNFWGRTPKKLELMLTYPKSTMRVRRMPMHLSSGHVTLMPGKFYSPSLLFS